MLCAVVRFLLSERPAVCMAFTDAFEPYQSLLQPNRDLHFWRIRVRFRIHLSIPLCVCVLLVTVSSVRLSEVKTGTLGKPYLLNCSHRSPQTFNLNESYIYWQSEFLLFFYNKGYPHKEDISPQFINRTSVFPDLLASGNLSLLINPLKVTDDGLKVKVKVKGTREDTTTMCELQISGAAPYSDLQVGQNDKEEAVCSAVGGYPEPSLTWTGQKQKCENISLTALIKTETLQDGTYSVSSSVSVEGLMSVTCHLHNLRANQSISYTKSLVPEDTDWRAVAIAGWVVVAGFVVVILAVVIYYRCTRTRRPEGVL